MGVDEEFQLWGCRWCRGFVKLALNDAQDLELPLYAEVWWKNTMGWACENTHGAISCGNSLEQARDGYTLGGEEAEGCRGCC